MYEKFINKSSKQINMALEFVLGVKAGIGRNFAEAEAALQVAKGMKERVLPSDTPEIALRKVEERYLERTFAIHQYSGEV